MIEIAKLQWPELRDSLRVDEPALEKLAAWELDPEAGGPREFVCRGSDQFAALIVEKTIESLPAPVRDYALRKCAFTAFGLSVGGSCGAKLEQSEDRPWEILICGHTHELLKYRTAHELGHAWNQAEPPPGLRNWNIHTRDMVDALKIKADDPESKRIADEFEHEIIYQEGLADWLAEMWGYPRPKSN